jgi:hypothetical protein
LWNGGQNNDDRLIVAAIQRLRVERRPLLEFWTQVAVDLAGAGRLPVELRSLADVSSAAREPERADLKTVLAMSVSDRQWTYEWERVWDSQPYHRSLLVQPAVDWVRANRTHKAIPHILKRLMDEEEPADSIALLGCDWLRSSPVSAHGWGFVLNGVVRLGRRDAELIDKARAWLAPSFERRGTWPLVWSALWDFELAERQPLAASALRWLEFPDPTRHGFAEVWCRAWDAGYAHDTLRTVAVGFLMSKGAKGGQGEVNRRLTQGTLSDEVRPI